MRLGMRTFAVEDYIRENPHLKDREFRADRAVIGTFEGRPISEIVVDTEGHRYRYVGLARRRRDGRFDVATLGPGEWIVEPGLVYSLDETVTPKSGM